GVAGEHTELHRRAGGAGQIAEAQQLQEHGGETGLDVLVERALELTLRQAVAGGRAEPALAAVRIAGALHIRPVDPPQHLEAALGIAAVEVGGEAVVALLAGLTHAVAAHRLELAVGVAGGAVGRLARFSARSIDPAVAAGGKLAHLAEADAAGAA